MRSRSNSSNKAGKKIIEAKTVFNYSSLETYFELRLQRLRYKSTEKLLKKTKIKNPNLSLKTLFFKKHNRILISTKSDSYKFQHFWKRINNQTKSRAHKKQNQKEVKTSNNFTT